MRVVLSPHLLSRLRELRGHAPDPVEAEHDAFLMDPGLGPASYITSDGRVLLDCSAWDDTGLREATEHEAIAALVVGARNTGLDALLALLPQRPTGIDPCTTCGGQRMLGGILLCHECHGRGWLVPTR